MGPCNSHSLSHTHTHTACCLILVSCHCSFSSARGPDPFLHSGDPLNAPQWLRGQRSLAAGLTHTDTCAHMHARMHTHARSLAPSLLQPVGQDGAFSAPRMSSKKGGGDACKTPTDQSIHMPAQRWRRGGGGWSLEVALETISARANTERADFRERGFRMAGVFVFSFLFSPLARRISSERACDGGGGIEGGWGGHFKSTG